MACRLLEERRARRLMKTAAKWGEIEAAKRQLTADLKNHFIEGSLALPGRVHLEGPAVCQVANSSHEAALLQPPTGSMSD